MAITLTGSEGWFTRAGDFVGEYNRVAALYGTALDAGFLSIWAQFASTDQAAVQNYPDAVTAFRQSSQTYQGTLVADGQLASVLQADRNFPLSPYTYTASVQAVRAQMLTTAQSINRPTLGSTVTNGASNIGNTQFWLSTTNVYGDPLDMTLAETLTVLCTSQGSGFSASFSITGETAVSPTAWNWPQGSGASASVSAVDPAVDGIISNGGFSAFTVTNTPDDWTIVDGAAGVTVFKSTAGGVRSGTDAVYLQSDGAQATQLSQNVSLSINTVYAVTFQAKINSASVTGSLVVEITDSTGTALDNDAGDALTYTRDLNGQVTTSYQQFTVFFSTPRQLPSTVQLRIGYGVAGVSTRQLTLDLVQVFAATPLYGVSGTGTSGPFVAAVANTLVNAVNDSYLLDFTNSLTTQSFALGMERVFGLRSLGVYLPSSGSPTIADSLVTH